MHCTFYSSQACCVCARRKQKHRGFAASNQVCLVPAPELCTRRRVISWAPTRFTSFHPPNSSRWWAWWSQETEAQRSGLICSGRGELASPWQHIHGSPNIRCYSKNFTRYHSAAPQSGYCSSPPFYRQGNRGLWKSVLAWGYTAGKRQRFWGS